MGLNDLLAGQNRNEQPKKRGPKPKTVKMDEIQHSFTVRHYVSTKILLDKIQKLKELTTPGADNVSKGEIIRDALELYAERMEFAKLTKKFPEFLVHINAEAILKNNH